jgi:Flp pilus assembly pilin Flp
VTVNARITDAGDAPECDASDDGRATSAARPRRESAKEVTSMRLTALQPLVARLHREEGQTMAEYAVVLAVVTLLVIGAITLLSTNIGNEITKIAGILTN